MDPTDLIGQLLAALDSAPPSDTLGVLTGFLADAIGSRSTSVLLVDYDLNTLTPLPDGTSPSRPGQPVEGTDAGTVFRSQKVLRVARPERVRVSIPISLRAERLGVLELDLPPESEEPGFLHALRTLGTCTAYVLKTALPLSDVLERARRREPMALLQWALQPIRGFDGPAFSIARQLVPAYEVGGDMFDYAVQAGSLQVAVTDAMGHGLHASLLTTLAVNTLRNERRSGAPIEAQAVRADQTLHAQFAGEQFVTGPRSRSCHRQARRGECRLAAGVPGERPGRRVRAVRPGATVPRISGTTPRSCASTGAAPTRLCPQPALTLPGLPHRLQEFLAPVPDLVPGRVDRRPPRRRQPVAPLEVTPKVKLRSVVGPALGLDDGPVLHETEIPPGYEVAVLVEHNVLLHEVGHPAGDQHLADQTLELGGRRLVVRVTLVEEPTERPDPPPAVPGLPLDHPAHRVDRDESLEQGLVE